MTQTVPTSQEPKKLTRPVRSGESFGGRKRTGLPFTHCVRVGIPLSTRDDLGALRFPNLLRIEPLRFSSKLRIKKLTRPVRSGESFGGAYRTRTYGPKNSVTD